MINILRIRNGLGEICSHEVSEEVYNYVIHLEFALENEQVKKAFYKKYKNKIENDG